MSEFTDEEMNEMFRLAHLAEECLKHPERALSSVDISGGDEFVPLPEFTEPPRELSYRTNLPTMDTDDDKEDLAPLDSIFMDGFDPNRDDSSSTTDDGLFSRMNHCEHAQLTETSDGNVCISCGKVIGHTADLTPEWRYYGSNDSRFSSDPTRVAGNYRREHKNIAETELIPLGIPYHVAIKANQIYHMMSIERPFRGKSSRHDAALFACVYGACQQLEHPLPPEMVNKYFNLERGSMSRGIKEYVHVMKKRGIELGYVTVPKLIFPILEELYGGIEYPWFTDIRDLATELLTLNYELFHRSSPQSIATALIYWYLTNHDLGDDVKIPTRSEYAVFTNLSDITLNKFVKEIRAVMACK